MYCSLEPWNLAKGLDCIIPNKVFFFFLRDHFSLLLWGGGTARSSNQAPNNATQTKQKAHKQE